MNDPIGLATIPGNSVSCIESVSMLHSLKQRQTIAMKGYESTTSRMRASSSSRLSAQTSRMLISGRVEGEEAVVSFAATLLLIVEAFEWSISGVVL